MRNFKYKFQLLIILTTAIALVSCSRYLGPNNPGNINKNNMQETAGKYKFPKNPTRTGKGVVIVKTPSGNSENGNIPVIVIRKDTSLTQLGVDLDTFNNEKEVFLYINKVFVDKVQGGRYSVNTINLTGKNLKAGDYTLSAVQFENNDPDKKVVQYSEAKYKIQQGT